MIEVQGLEFEYPGRPVFSGLSFVAPRASVTALVGPNGSGKTTLLRCLSALLPPLSGTIRLDGVDVARQPRACHRLLGFLADDFGLYHDLTVGQCLRFAGRSRGLDGVALQEKTDEVCRLFALEDKRSQVAGSLSRGWRQRLGMAQAMIHRPAILLLDEPASGLDPEARVALARIFLALRDQGMTLLVSSHILAELEAYADHMLILRDGAVTIHRALAGREQGRPLEILLARPDQRLGEWLGQHPQVQELETTPERAVFHFAGDLEAQHRLLSGLVGAGLPVTSFAEKKEILQHLYLSQSNANRGGSPT